MNNNSRPCNFSFLTMKQKTFARKERNIRMKPEGRGAGTGGEGVKMTLAINRERDCFLANTFESWAKCFRGQGRFPSHRLPRTNRETYKILRRVQDTSVR